MKSSLIFLKIYSARVLARLNALIKRVPLQPIPSMTMTQLPSRQTKFSHLANQRVNKNALYVLEMQLNNLSFSLFLQAARRSMNLSQKSMARRLKISRQTIQDIEQGRILVSSGMAIKIANISGLSKTLAVKACLQDQLRRAKIKMNLDLYQA